MDATLKARWPTRWWRLFRLALWLIQMVWVCYLHYPFLSQSARDRRTGLFARQALAILQVHTEVAGHSRPHISHTLFAANHVSWLDMLALRALYPMSFVAKKEIRSWPFLGRVAAMAGSIFIDRTRRRDADGINHLVADHLQQGRNVAFFPEARTSEDGLHVHPFKAALFEAAIKSASDIQPVVIRFYDGQNRRTVLPAYSDQVSLLGSVRNILSMRKIIIRLDFLACIPAASVVTAERFTLKDRIEAVVMAVAESDIDTSLHNQCSKDW